MNEGAVLREVGDDDRLDVGPVGGVREDTGSGEEDWRTGEEKR